MKTTLLVLSFSILGLAQPPQGPAPGGPPPGGHMQMPPPKNLKLLSPEHLMERMQAFRVALGVRCDFCHVQGDFASDEKPHKQMARMMIQLERDINAKFPDGKMHVTCYTCHRGAEEPATRPGEGAAAERREHHEGPPQQ